MPQSILAHTIIYRGRCYHLHVATYTPATGLQLRPFTAETPSTIFIEGTIEIFIEQHRLNYRRLT